MRTGISLLATGLYAAACSGDGCGSWGVEGPATAIGVGMLIGLGVSMIYDIVVVSDHVERRNARLAAREPA